MRQILLKTKQKSTIFAPENKRGVSHYFEFDPNTKERWGQSDFSFLLIFSIWQ